jgi:hypothetical protein
MVINSIVMGIGYGGQFLSGHESGRDLLWLLIFAVLIASMYTIPKLIKALYLFLRNGSVEGSLKQVGWVVLETLQHMELIKTSSKHLKINTIKDKMGIGYCRIDGATNIEKRHFLEAMKEVLGPVQNPRYVLVRESYLGRLLRVDYHPVPKAVATKKKHAEFFHKKWKRYVGDTGLVYTRSIKGRSILLKARTKSLSSSFVKKTDQISVWE